MGYYDEDGYELEPGGYDDWDEQEAMIGEFLIDGVGFANEGSALRAATDDNPRELPCPTCGRENMLTPLDVQRGYQCDICADAAEGHPSSFSEY